MSDGCKQVLSPFAGGKKQKSWSKTKEKYMPVKRRQNLAETQTNRQGIILQRRMVRRIFRQSRCILQWCRNASNNDENNEQQQLPEGFSISCYKIV